MHSTVIEFPVVKKYWHIRPTGIGIAAWHLKKVRLLTELNVQTVSDGFVEHVTMVIHTVIDSTDKNFQAAASEEGIIGAIHFIINYRRGVIMAN